MIAEEVLEEVRSRGAHVEARGEVLHIEAPRGALSPELVAAMRQLKPELLRLVGLASLTVGNALGGVTELDEPSFLVAEVCALPLEDFACAGLAVKVWSKVLGAVVILASDDAQLDPGELRTVYRAHELRALLYLRDPSELRSIHAYKKTFRGTIIDVSFR